MILLSPEKVKVFAGSHRTKGRKKQDHDRIPCGSTKFVPLYYRIFPSKIFVPIRMESFLGNLQLFSVYKNILYVDIFKNRFLRFLLHQDRWNFFDAFFQ